MVRRRCARGDASSGGAGRALCGGSEPGLFLLRGIDRAGGVFRFGLGYDKGSHSGLERLTVVRSLQGAKAVAKLGLIKEYRWAFGVVAVLLVLPAIEAARMPAQAGDEVAARR